MTQPSRPSAIFLMGPTASGKTALAGELLARFPVELISVDAAQVYRGMDIGTAKPSPDELRRVPHHLIDIRDPDEAYSAADFRTDALRLMAGITARGRIPLLVGGTFLYFRALEHGLSTLPAADPAVRARILAEAQQLGWGVLHERLRAADPASAARIHPNDPQRLQRALELMAVTGQTPSELYEAGRASLDYDVIKIIIAPSDRQLLAQRIDTRFRAMLTQGLVEEARQLFEKYRNHPDIPALRTVGYRQAGLYLTGKINYDEMVESAIAATRQYAKRQLTWLRAEAGAGWFDSDQPGLVEAVAARLAASLGNDRYTVR